MLMAERTAQTESEDRVPGMEAVYEHPRTLNKVVTHYCPGCTHGIGQRLVAEALDELGLRERTILVASVGCSVFVYNYFDVDAVQAAHGRAPAMATGIKRLEPDRIVLTYQGDGDMASIGLAEVVHAAVRGEKITTIFINNAIYGMTGGQMAPTSLPKQQTTSSPFGRDVGLTGNPLRMSELLAGLDGSAYIVRRSLHDARNVLKAKKAVLTALKVQMHGLGFSMVELLSSCPTNWGLSPEESLKWIENEMIPYFPLGDYKVADEVAAL
jgi:2-oxoglutarate ferredoxin oxidoreductase subunit beta